VWLLLGAGATLVVYTAFVAALMLAGRRGDAVALARFIPDFLPVAGQFDDALMVALVLRAILRAGGPELVREHWRGPDKSLEVLLRLSAGARSARVG
jgi:uncharacterized membrane protein YkvA (DUF1232 family)